MFIGLQRNNFAVAVIIILRCGERQYGYVAPVTPRLLVWLCQQGIGQGSSGKVCPAVTQMSHGLLGLDPRPPAGRPTRTGLQAEPQAQTVCLFGRVAHQFLPLGTQTLDVLLRARPVLGVAHLPVKELHALYARGRDGFEVLRNTLTPDTPVEKVKPRLRIVDAVGMQERLLIGPTERPRQLLLAGYCRITGSLCRDVIRPNQA